MTISNNDIPQDRVNSCWSIDLLTNPYYWDIEYHDVVTHNRRGRKKKENNVRYKGRNMSKRT
jgi:hypothetical protein